MPRTFRFPAPTEPARFPAAIPLATLALALLLAGCKGEKPTEYQSVTAPPKVRLVEPARRTIVRTIGQPSFIESYERTSVYPKLTAYIEKWVVDIGDQVKKGDTLATLFVPELVEDRQTKHAVVKLNEERVELARQVVEVASADVKAAQAALAESKAILSKYEAEAQRWDTEVKRLDKEVKRGVIDPQVLLESTNQWRSSLASRDAARATIDRSSAEVLSSEAKLAKAKVDVGVAQADLAVARSDAKRLDAWVGYLTLQAPFDGVIVVRNANTFDFVLPNAGDPTAMRRSPDVSTGGAAPVYVVDRTDIVRVFVDIPEADANYVRVGTKATVLARAYSDEPVSGSVTRTAWALNVKSRTLRAEIDLSNPGARLLPGMYAYANVIIERPHVPAVPVSALTYSGDRTFCWTFRDGRATRTEVRTGVSDGEWVELTGIKRAPAGSATTAWGGVDGSERLILGDLSVLNDGEKVEVTSGDEPRTPVRAASAGPPAEAGPTAGG